MSDANTTTRTDSVRCYDLFDTGTSSKAAYSGFTSSDDYLTNSIVTTNAIYATKAFKTDLGSNYSQAQTKLDEMFSDSWIDSQTRAIIVSGNMLNRNYQIVVSAQIVLEILPTGAVPVWPNFYYIRMTDFGTGSDTGFVIAADVFVLFYVGALLYVAAGKIRNHGFFRYFRVVWNLLDVCIVAGVIFTTAERKPESTYKALFEELNPQEHIFDDEGISYASAQRNTTLLNCILIFMAMLRTIKFLERNRQVERFWRVLVLVYPHMITLGFLVAVYTAAFTFSCYIAIGWGMPQFSRIDWAFLGIAREFLGGYAVRDGKSMNWLIREKYPIYAQWFRANIFFIKYCLLYLFTALFLGGMVQVMKEHRTYKLKVSHNKNLRRWAPLRTKNSEFWKYFCLGRFAAKRPIETVGTASILPVTTKKTH